jgi:peptide-methionine (S)-S-oxide reductase
LKRLLWRVKSRTDFDDDIHFDSHYNLLAFLMLYTHNIATERALTPRLELHFSADMNALKNFFRGAAANAERAPLKHSATHYVLKNPVDEPFPAHISTVVFATGCFWGTEKMFWRIPGVYTTAVGYIAGHTPNPTYEEVCTGRTGHTECVRVAYDPSRVAFADLLQMHWTCHDPTQGNRQGNDVGTQYRSGIYCTTDAQYEEATSSKDAYQQALTDAGWKRSITTEIKKPGEATFYFAENSHQQYIAKTGNSYCSAQPTGVRLPRAWLASRGAKFDDAFWLRHGPKPGCTINVPDAPIAM